ncbi:hypothetical protein SDJN02_25637, partial [Cucurbita argyrosperma subsp. argyrosperma]
QLGEDRAANAFTEALKTSDEDELTRVVVTRAEKDLRQIKEAYHKRNSVTLDDAVSKETSGDYKHFILALLGNNQADD